MDILYSEELDRLLQSESNAKRAKCSVECVAQCDSLAMSPNFLGQLVSTSQKIVRSCLDFPDKDDYLIMASVPQGLQSIDITTAKISKALRLIEDLLPKQRMDSVSFARMAVPGRKASTEVNQHIDYTRDESGHLDVNVLRILDALSTEFSQAQVQKPKVSVAPPLPVLDSKESVSAKSTDQLKERATDLTSSKSKKRTTSYKLMRQIHLFVPLMAEKICGRHRMPTGILEAQTLIQQYLAQTISMQELKASLAPIKDQMISPYTSEIEQLDWKNPSSPEGKLALLTTPFKCDKLDLNRVSFDYIDSKRKWVACLTELANYEVVAIDVEHHSACSYLGKVCLIQISTKDRDYIIDPLKIPTEMRLLNYITADPGILKILHGANNDVTWLQRDFEVYLVNMLDTSFCAAILEYDGLSLAYLLQKICKVKTSKEFQRADWRKRPLTPAQLHYARLDSRHLPYIFSRLHHAILKRPEGSTLLLSALKRSSKLALKVPIFRSRNFSAMAQNWIRSNTASSDTKLASVMIKLLEWREAKALAQDLNPSTVLCPSMTGRLAQEAAKSLDRAEDFIRHCKSLQSYHSELLSVIAAGLEPLEKEEEVPLAENDQQSIPIVPLPDDSVQFYTTLKSCSDDVAFPQVKANSFELSMFEAHLYASQHPFEPCCQVLSRCYLAAAIKLKLEEDYKDYYDLETVS